MKQFVKPRVVVSKCLEFEACRYNGDVIHDPVVKSLKPFVEFIPTCPEVEIGLGVPRETIRIVTENGDYKLIQPTTKEDLTDKMNTFSNSFLSSLPEVDGFILKSRSPSCGTQDVRIYGTKEKSPVKEKGSGLFGGKVLESYGYLAIEEEGRLKNFQIREHFFIKLFTLATFREMKKKPTIQSLIEFQSNNKYLFMAYNQLTLKELGRLVANHEKKQIEDVFTAYETILHKLLSKSSSYQSNVNVCQHIFGYFSKELTKTEKSHFLDLLHKYQDKKIPLSTLTSLLKSWTLRFESEYLNTQTYFNPYPEQLVEITDSGKGRDY